MEYNSQMTAHYLHKRHSLAQSACQRPIENIMQGRREGRKDECVCIFEGAYVEAKANSDFPDPCAA